MIVSLFCFNTLCYTYYAGMLFSIISILYFTCIYIKKRFAVVVASLGSAAENEYLFPPGTCIRSTTGGSLATAEQKREA